MTHFYDCSFDLLFFLRLSLFSFFTRADSFSILSLDEGHEGAKTIVCSPLHRFAPHQTRLIAELFVLFRRVSSQWPSEVYDIRGVFDGSILNPGHNGYPTILYTSTYTSRLGATAPGGEEEGAETQSIGESRCSLRAFWVSSLLTRLLSSSSAWTEDGGASWIKLPFGSGGNPVLTNWPERNVSEFDLHVFRCFKPLQTLSDRSNQLSAGFRDPYIFRSPQLSALIASTNATSTANGTHFATISGGRHDIGPKLWLYRQKEDGNALEWEYLGGFVGEAGGGGVGGVKSSWSEWSGSENLFLSLFYPFENFLADPLTILSSQTSEVTSRPPSSLVSTRQEMRPTTRPIQRLISSRTELSKVDLITKLTGLSGLL